MAEVVTIPDGENAMKNIHVVCAVILHDGKIFATQRGYGDFKDGWEFPGGKIEENETPQETVVREIREELDAVVEVSQYGVSVEYDYPDFHLSMDCLFCSLKEGKIRLLEHEAARWLRLNELRQVNWLPADELVVGTIEKGGMPDLIGKNRS